MYRDRAAGVRAADSEELGAEGSSPMRTQAVDYAARIQPQVAQRPPSPTVPEGSTHPRDCSIRATAPCNPPHPDNRLNAQLFCPPKTLKKENSKYLF